MRKRMAKRFIVTTQRNEDEQGKEDGKSYCKSVKMCRMNKKADGERMI
jgi:hypothetical protein